MSYEIIKLGVLPNDGKGDTLQVAFEKVNQNFAALFSLTTDLSPERIITGLEPTDSSGETLTSAISKLNNNFSKIQTLAPEVQLRTFSTTDPLRHTFENINSTFYDLFNVLQPVETSTQIEIPSTEVVEVITPVETTEDASFSGNINITNNYNFFVSNPESEVSSAPLSIPTGPFGAQEVINVGAAANDGTGDPLRTAFQKINNNFSNLFYTATNTYSVYSTGLDPNQVLVEIPVASFTQATFQIQSNDENTTENQGITIAAQLMQNGVGVKFTGYGTTFTGSGICNYDMDISSGNVRLLTNPIANTTIFHFISAQVTFTG